MIKTLTNLFKQDKEKFVVPKGVHDYILFEIQGWRAIIKV